MARLSALGLVFYLWGPTGVVMEFDTLGNSKAITYDPQGSCVGTVDTTTWASNPSFYDGYGELVWSYSSINGQSDRRALQQPLQYKGQFGYYNRRPHRPLLLPKPLLRPKNRPLANPRPNRSRRRGECV